MLFQTIILKLLFEINFVQIYNGKNFSSFLLSYISIYKLKYINFSSLHITKLFIYKMYKKIQKNIQYSSKEKVFISICCLKIINFGILTCLLVLMRK